MNPTDEMFILVLVAISIVGVVCLGLMILLGLGIRGGFNRNNPPTPIVPPPIGEKPDSLPKEFLSNFEGLRKEIVLGTSIAIYGLSFAFFIYFIGMLRTNVLQGFAGLILAIITLYFGNPNTRRWIAANRSKAWTILIAILILLFVIIILSFYFIYTIPIPT
jgi:hypothetical protein